MQMLYNSDSYAVVMFDVPADASIAGNDDTVNRGGYEIGTASGAIYRLWIRGATGAWAARHERRHPGSLHLDFQTEAAPGMRRVTPGEPWRVVLALARSTGTELSPEPRRPDLSGDAA